MNLRVEFMEERHIDACIKLFMYTFSKKPWNEEYIPDKKVRQYFVNFLNSSAFLGFVGYVGDEPAALVWD